MFETHKRADALDKRNFKILNTLKTMEMNWTKQQKEQLVNKVKKTKKKIIEYAESILKKCKAHGGPFTTANELNVSLKSSPDDLKKHLRHEIVFKRQLN